MNIVKAIARWTAIVVLVLLLLAAVVPFLIPVSPLANLQMAQAAASPQSQFVTIPFAGTDGIDIHYLADEAQGGDEPTFVLLHGSNFNAFTWNEVLDFFDDRGRVIAYDQIPYGLSEKLVEGDWSGPDPYSGDAAVTQLFALLDTLGVDSTILVANSYGAVLAVEAAATSPERVDGMILADAAVYVQESLPAWFMNLPQMQRLGLPFARTIGGSEAFVRQTYLDPSRIDDERMRLTMIHTEVIGWDEAMWDYLQTWGTTPLDVTGHLATLAQPSFVITGDSDTVIPPADSERLANTLPNAEYVVLTSCGHVPQEECPEQFEEVVGAWLDSNAW